MPFLTRDGCELYYEVHGDGPALVFAHGAGGNQLSWWQQVPYFQQRYRCITFAHRGFAPSTAPPDGPGREAFVDDLAALLDHLDLPQVHLVAQSMGGWTALGYALRFPSRVRSLVMASTTGGVASLIADAEVERLRAGQPTRDELLARSILPGHERLQREQPSRFFLYRGITAMRDARSGPPSLSGILRAVVQPDSLAVLTMPVLCLAGEEDTIMFPAALAALAARVPNGRYVAVPQSGHSVYFERADAFNRILDEFLAEVDR